YWAAYMYHHYFTNNLLATDLGGASRDRLAAYASQSPDGSLYLMVVNKDPSNDVSMPVTINGYTPAGAATMWTWSADNYAWDASTGRPSKNDPPKASVIGAAGTFTRTFPKYSITAIKL